LDENRFRKLISGQSSSFASKALLFLLSFAAFIYSIIIAARNFLYSKRWLKVSNVDAAVISVGNITAGGTGKTPLVIWTAKLLEGKNIPAAILTRGYKTKKEKFSDEPAILAKSCPQSTVIINQNRVAAATKAIHNHGAKALILDDGFQHRRLGRDVDIVTIDAMQPFGHRKLLPAGLLREPLSALNRAHAVVITRANQVSQSQLTQLLASLKDINPDMIIATAIHEPVCANSMHEKQIELKQMEYKKVFAFCGIGNPDAFFSTIEELKINITGSKVYNDHHRYTAQDIADIYCQARNLGADMILSTQKDWTKTILLIPPKAPNRPEAEISEQKDITFAYLQIKLRFNTKEDKITRLIDSTLKGKIIA
jgi:tetraacyldisaccharide 4'-kinase